MAKAFSGSGNQEELNVAAKKRIDWVDYAKGITIILVVFHHAIGTDPIYQSSVGEGLQTFNGWLTYFRMPLFIFIAGLFIKKALHSEWGGFLETKVLHFLYLFTLWSFIKEVLVPLGINLLQTDAAEIAESVNPLNFAAIFVTPPNTLWFIYALLIFFVVMRLCRGVPPAVVLTIAAIIYALTTTAHTTEPAFFARLGHLFPFFALGYFGSAHVRRFAEHVRPYYLVLLPLYLLLTSQLLAANSSARPLIFVAEIMGITTGVVVAKLTADFLAESPLKHIKRVGAHSLAVYLGHFFPILMIGVLAERGLIRGELLVFGLEFSLGVLLPIALFKACERSDWMWLYRVPERLRLPHRRVSGVGRGLEG